MAFDLTIREGVTDSVPVGLRTVIDHDEVAYDLTGRQSFEFRARRADGTGSVIVYVEGPQLVVYDAAGGDVLIIPGVSDFVQGTYKAWFKVVDSSSRVVSLPSGRDMSVSVIKSY